MARTFMALALVLGLSWTAPALAQVSCFSQIDRELVQDPVNVNRDTPVGSPLSPRRSLSGTGIRCEGNAVNEVIEVVGSFPAERNARPNPWGAGILVDTPIAGIGYVFETSPRPMGQGETVLIEFVRSNKPGDVIGSVALATVYAVKTGPIDLRHDQLLHDIELLRVRWRTRGNPAAQQHVMSFRVATLVDTSNVFAETCFFGVSPGRPEVRTHVLPSVNRAQFRGEGTEAGFANFLPLDLTCRRFLGGHLSVESSTARTGAGMEGVVESIRADGMATGVGLRIRNGPGGDPWDFQNRWPLAGHPIGGDKTFNLPYAVTYIQTAPALTPGRIEAVVTLTVTYD